MPVLQLSTSDAASNEVIYYRYRDYSYGPFTHVVCDKFVVVKKTARGAWIVPDHGTFSTSMGRHFVLDNAKKRFAYPTRLLALESFLARKTRQIQIYTGRLEDARRALAQGKSMLGEVGPVHEIKSALSSL